MVCDQLLRIGFRRLYVIQFHGPGIALMRLAREFFEETGVPLAFYGLMRMPDDGQDECREKGVAWEASLAAAANDYLGFQATIDPDALPDDVTRPKIPGSEARAALSKTGAFIGSLGTSDLHHGPFREQLDGELGLDILWRMARSIASSADSMAELRDAWDGADLPESYPSMIPKR